MATRIAVGDLEGNNLWPSVDRLWCGSFYEYKSKEWTIFTPDNIHELPEFLDVLDYIVFHNGIYYDRPVIQKILGYTIPEEKLQDSLKWCNLLWPDLKAPKGVSAGPHSIDAWGVRFNIKKPSHEDWSRYSEEMLHRNKEDTKIGTNLWFKIKKEIKYEF